MISCLYHACSKYKKALLWRIVFILHIARYRIHTVYKMALSGKVALVTGGVKNLGADIARELANVGANLALHYNSNSSKADATKLEAELKQKYPSVQVKFYQGDLTTADAVTHLFKAVVADFQKVDIVINTIGKVLKKPITEITEAEYDSMFAYAFLSCCHISC
jgi:NAD(P)-dependent dehydrogenase (short-subunit alcohol dehydrogenase family)